MRLLTFSVACALLATGPGCNKSKTAKVETDPAPVAAAETPEAVEPAPAPEAAAEPAPKQAKSDPVKAGAKALADRYTTDRNRLKGYQAYRGKKYSPAATYFLACIAKEPRDIRSHYYLGLVATEYYKDAQYAQRHLEQAYTLYLNRKDPPSNQQLPGVDPAVPWPSFTEIGDALAEAIFQGGDRDVLVAFCRQAIEERGHVDDYLRLASFLHKAGDPDSARDVYHQAIDKAGPKNPAAHLGIADFYEAVGARSQALDHLVRAYGMTPGDSKIKQRIRDHGVVPGPTLLPGNQPKKTSANLPNTDGQPLPGKS